MYSKLPNLVIAFHGCNYDTFENVLYKHQHITKSQNSYDWLGHGIYFWENSYDRALNWAKENKDIEVPAVIGAIIDLGYCLNMTDYRSTSIIKSMYDLVKLECAATESDLPVNRDLKGTKGKVIRDLDCAVIQRLHLYNKENGKKPFDSIRGVFVEGKPIYPDAGFMEKTHIQLCIVKQECIKGYFSPLSST